MTSVAAIKEELRGVEAELRRSEASSLALAKREFREFLKWVKVFDKPPGRGTIAFEFWPHLDEMIEALPVERLIIWMKARRDGASWLIAAYIAFRGQKAGGYFPLASQGEAEAIELLTKVRFVWEHLPGELKWGGLTTDSRTELKWGNEGSHVQAMPSTGKASRGNAVTVGVIDEADFHEYLRSFYYSMKPSVDDSRGQLFLVSTVNYESSDSLFLELWDGAPGNGFRKFFHGWRARPGHDQAWYDALERSYPDKVRLHREFPETAEQAMAPPETLAAFSREALDAMRGECREPIETVQGVGHIWQRWYTGKRYVVFTDTSHGVGADDGVTVVMDVQTGYVVADVHSNVLSPEALALASVELLGRYDNPVWGIEDNDWGRVTIEKAKALGYPRLFYRSEGQPGWHTNEGNRLGLWGNLVEAVGQRLITVPSTAGLAQFYRVIRNPKKEGRIEAQAGAKDDYPNAVGGCWALRHRAVLTHGQPAAVQLGRDMAVRDFFGTGSRSPGLRW